jgi:hypothetical protein
MRPALLAVAAVLCACKEPARPPWATPPARGIAGDATVTGAPAKVARLAAPPVIDGKLDEPAWGAAAVLGPFVDPGDGAAVSVDHPVAAFARLGWDDRHLYLGVVVGDREPRSPFTRDAVDPHIWAEASGVELMLQPGDPGDNRQYVEIQVDVAGAVWDTRFDDYNAPITGAGAERRFGHQDWSAGLARAVSAGNGFYAVELALPFAQLAGGARVPVPPRPGDVWRVNLYTFRDGQRQALAWSPLRGEGNFHKASRFGRVQFE